MSLDLKNLLGSALNSLDVKSLGLGKADEEFVSGLIAKIKKKQTLTTAEKNKALDLLGKMSSKISPSHKKMVMGLLDQISGKEKDQTLVKKIKKSL